VDLNDPRLTTSGERIQPFTNNPWLFRVFRDFWVRWGLETSLELKQLDQAIAAQKRLLESAQRAHYAPTVGLQADWTERLADGGAGANGGLDIGIPIEFPEADDSNWSVGLSLSLPLYAGGERKADRKQAEQELARLRTVRTAMAERLEQRIRSSFHSVAASEAGMDVAQDAAEAAQKNLELVTDAYGQGVVSIVELIDAQNAALVAQLGAATAVYDYLMDLFRAQRSVGWLDFFVDTELRTKVFQDIVEHYRELGAVPSK
jgi:outer membrane protein TolC